MKSIFMLEKYNIVSMTILKKLYESNVSYLNLECYGEKILKDLKLRQPVIEDIMASFEKSRNDPERNSISELTMYGLIRTHCILLKEKNVTISDIESLTKEEFCHRFDIKEKVYHAIIESYTLLKEHNFNIPFQNDYSEIILWILKNKALFTNISKEDLKNILERTTYPLEYLESDIKLLDQKDLIEVNGEYLCYNVPPLKEKVLEVKRIDDRNLEILNQRLSGLTLNEVGEKFGVTRERIRQIIENIYSKLGIVKEDKYKTIFEKYDLSHQEFTTIFQEPTETYYYLFDRYQHGLKELSEIKEEEFVDEAMEERINSLLNYCLIDGEYVIATRNGITKYYLKNKCDGEMFVDDLFNNLNQFIQTKFPNGEIPLYESSHNLEGILGRKEWCISGKNKKYRYYEINLLSKEDIEALSNMLNVEFGLYSCLYFYENNLDLMEQLDIRNEQELHNIIRNVIKVENVEINRMPNLLIGYQDKNTFFIDKFNELSPITMDEYLKYMRINFGHRKDSLLGYLASELEEYITNGMINTKIDTLLVEETELLTNAFSKTLYLLNDFYKQLKELGIKDISKVITNMNLKKIGYKLFGSFIIKDHFTTLEDAFYQSIIHGEFHKKMVNYNSTTYEMINRLEKSKKIIEINEKYFPYEIIYNLGITEDDIEEFETNLKLVFYNSKQYFTVKTIRNMINAKLLRNNNVPNSLIVSFTRNIKETKRVIWHGNSIFIYQETAPSRKQFLTDYIRQNEGLNLKELSIKLKEDYDLEINPDQVGWVIRSCDNVKMMNSRFFMK